MTSAIARGARLSREPLNTFLSSKSASTIEGSRIYPENNAALTKLLHGLGLDPQIRVRAIMPIGRNSKGSSYIFVCWEWNYVLYAKEIGTALPGRRIPTGFKEAVQKIQKDAAFGVWCVSLTDEWGVMKDELADSVRMHQPLFGGRKQRAQVLSYKSRTSLSLQRLMLPAESLHLRIRRTTVPQSSETTRTHLDSAQSTQGLDAVRMKIFFSPASLKTGLS